jgi:hypothetical protein
VLHESTPWFNGPDVGVGLCLPKVWQGWMAVGAGLVSAVLGSVFLHGVARECVPLAALLATRVTIQLKRAD